MKANKPSLRTVRLALGEIIRGLDVKTALGTKRITNIEINASGWWVNREFGVAWSTRGGKLELTRTAAAALKKRAEFIAEVEAELDLH